MPEDKDGFEEISDDIGFTKEELDSLIEGLLDDVVEADEVEVDENKVGLSQDSLPDLREDGLLVTHGDVWFLGGHKLVCGDCTEVDTLVKILDEGEPDALWADPPSQDLDDIEVGTTGVRIAAEYLKKGASVFVKYNPTSLDELSEMWVQPLRLASEIIWVAEGPVEEEKYFRRNHESIWYGWKFGGVRKWNAGGAVPTVYNYSRPETSETFSGIVPVELIGSVLKNSVEPGDIVYNPFAGFGSSLIACEQLGARCFCVEKSPKKCDLIIRRWQQFTGDKAYQENQ